MNSGNDHPQVDSVSLTDSETYVYEAIATLEYVGRPATRSQIAAAADLDGEALDDMFAELVRRGLLTRSEVDGEAAFEPAERGWSAAPDQAQGMKR
jgi:hypothetical protein